MLQRRPNWFSRKKGPLGHRDSAAGQGEAPAPPARRQPAPRPPRTGRARSPLGNMVNKCRPPTSTFRSAPAHAAAPAGAGPRPSGVPLPTGPQSRLIQPLGYKSELCPAGGQWRQARLGATCSLGPLPSRVATQRRSAAAAEAGGASPWPRAPALSRPWRAVEPRARRARRLAALARELWEQDVTPCTRVPGSGPRCCSHPALQDPACHRGAQSRLCLRAPEAAARNSRWLQGA